ncbi:hypothetical protein CWC25_10070 [Pseudoalteromonas sp. S4389]|uniref:hypothetical protein n=1 Tax=Pseudoalteromonas sp. S4389 TaxID=579556 RepID=UPI001108C9DB|nr:hypothetical protein [Pseudoalteromonas sp. S4389]TMO44132.1 hypothetical protein CWC25_10070 [Pseudoalteromonas sp. S4389]
MFLRNFMRYALLCVCFMYVTNNSAKEAHEHQENEQAEHANEVNLTEQQQQLANIKVERLVLKTHNQTLYAPGEIKAKWLCQLCGVTAR